MYVKIASRIVRPESSGKLPLSNAPCVCVSSHKILTMKLKILVTFVVDSGNNASVETLHISSF